MAHPRPPLLIALLAGCASAPAGPARVTPAGPAPTARSAQVSTTHASAPRLAPFPGWDRVDAAVFERRLPAWRAAAPDAALDPDARELLAVQLAERGQVGVRAALLLAWAEDRSADDALLARLEARAPAPDRARDATDCVAAAALSGRGTERGFPARLAALASGDEPHPDLEVRIECARSALAGGEDGVIPFLLRVLDAGTPAELAGPPLDWEPTETLAWAKSRAAEALSARAGVPGTFEPDGSFEDQAREAQRLALALGR